eukprot:TRINITY_DN4322_c0_g1_i8.p1 TRINITY_DN4322_c0_g1~~TRINITY_DN4322_c0_g1_i8.p1  ORF type:complete len:145 (-),score=10.11 TRINITY_DN4322_c0_g1_i8:4-438(-)
MNEIVELPNGKIVCAQHYLEVCGICCMDFTDMNVDSQDKEKGKKYYTDTFGFRYCNAHDEEVCKKCGVNEAAFNKKVEAKEKLKDKEGLYVEVFVIPYYHLSEVNRLSSVEFNQCIHYIISSLLSLEDILTPAQYLHHFSRTLR